MNYCYGKGVQNCVLCWEVVPISEGPLSEVPLYYIGKIKVKIRQCRASIAPANILDVS